MRAMRVWSVGKLASKTLVASIGLATSASFLVFPSALEAQDYAEIVEVDVVTVDVEVRDRDGNLVTDLERDDFRLFEDGQRVEVTNFERVKNGNASAPAVVAPAAAPAAAAPEPAAAHALSPEAPSPETAQRTIVYVDARHLTAASRARALAQLRSWVATLADGDEVMVAVESLGGLSVALPLSQERGAIDAALERLGTLAVHGESVDRDRATVVQAVISIQSDDILMGIPCAPNIADPVRAFADSTRQEVRRTLARMGGLVSSLAGMPGRKALVYVSDGLPLQPGADLFEVLNQMCGGGAATSGVGFPSQPAGGPGGPAERQKPQGGGLGIPLMDASVLGPGAYRAQSAALDAASYDLTNDLRRLASHASTNRVSLYTLQASGLRNTAAVDASLGVADGFLLAGPVAQLAVSNLREPLVYLAHETGGRAIVDTNDFAGELRRMRDGLGAFYSLGYAPKHRGEGKQHRIEVEVTRPGVRLAYRRTYRDKPALELVADRLVTVLVHGLEENPLEVAAEVAPPKALPNGHVLVTTRLLVPLIKLATLTHDEAYEAKLRVMVLAAKPGGESSGLRQLLVPVLVPHMQGLNAFGQKYAYDVGLELTPDVHDLAFAIRDELGGVTSYLRRRVDLRVAGTQR